MGKLPNSYSHYVTIEIQMITTKLSIQFRYKDLVITD